MKKLITVMAVATFLISMTGCKKSDSQQSQTTLQKIIGTWGLQSVIDNHHASGTDHVTTTTGASQIILTLGLTGNFIIHFQDIRIRLPTALPQKHNFWWAQQNCMISRP